MADRFRSFVARAPSSIASDIGTPKKRPSWWRPEGDRPRVRYRGQVQRYHTWQVNGGVDSQFFTQIEDKAASLVQDAGISAPGLDLFEIRLYAVAGEKSLEVSHPTVVVQNFNEVQLRKRAVKLLKDKLVKYPEYKGLRVSHWSTRDLPYGWTEQNECRVYSTPSFDVVYGPADASRALSSATVGLTVRIPLCSDSGKRSQQQNGTIAATVRLPGRQSLYYLAPAHIFLPGVFREHDNAEPDDEVDFDDFLDDEEPEITSRGSTSPPPSIFSNSRMNSSVTSLQSGASASSEDTLTFQQYDVDEEDGTGSPTPRAEETHRPPLELSPDQFEGCVMVSMALDYVLIETPEGADSLSLSEINGDTVGDIDAISDFNGIEVHLITLRAGAIQGRLLNSPALMVLPGSSQFQRLYPVILDQGSLQLGDSGAIVKDNATGKLYGHVVAGNPDTLFGDHGHVSIAYIVPSTRVLADIEARIGGLSTSVPETPQAVPEATVPEKKAGGKKNRYDIQLSLNWDITERLPPRTRNNYSGRSRRRFRHGRGESTPASERSVTRPSSRAHHMQRPVSRASVATASTTQTANTEVRVQYPSYAAAAARAVARPSRKAVTMSPSQPSRAPLREISQTQLNRPTMPLLGDLDTHHQAKDVSSVIIYHPGALTLRQQQVKTLPSLMQHQMDTHWQPRRRTAAPTRFLDSGQSVRYHHQPSRVLEAIRSKQAARTSPTSLPRFGSQEDLRIIIHELPAPPKSWAPESWAPRSWADVARLPRRKLSAIASPAVMERPVSPFRLPPMDLDESGRKSPASVGRRRGRPARTQTFPNSPSTYTVSRSSPRRWHSDLDSTKGSLSTVMTEYGQPTSGLALRRSGRG